MALRRDSPIKIRPPQSVPFHCIDSDSVSANVNHRIEFKHPGYSTDSNVFLTLPAPDGTKGGLDYETARTACGLLAGNRWDGFFSCKVDGEAIDASVYPVLPEGSYFFRLPPLDSGTALNAPYPLVPTFAHWRFPHRDLPPSWRSDTPLLLPSVSSARSNVSLAIVLRDGASCRVSKHEEACEMAHLCPSQENEWFHNNEMHKYVYDMRKTGTRAIDDLNNMILLKADLHKIFDDQKFVFVPKASPEGTPTFVTHLLCHSQELSMYFHNTALQPIHSIPREYLFARFAWSLFPFLEGFFQANTERAVTVRTGRRMANAEECKSYANLKGARSRTRSPKKRKMAEDADGGLEDEEVVPGTIYQPRDWGDAPYSTKRKIVGDSEGVLEDSVAAQVSIQEPKHRRNAQRCIKRRKHNSEADHGLDADVTFRSSLSPHTSREDFSATTPNTTPPLSEALDPEQSRMAAMKEQSLVEERIRSDTTGSWDREQDWALLAMKGPMSPRTLRSVYEILGYEVLEPGDIDAGGEG